MMTSKGFWHEKSNDTKPILKIDKQIDRYNRRFFIKPMKLTENNEYLSHSKKIALSETANFLENLIKEGGFGENREKNEGVFGENREKNEGILGENRDKNDGNFGGKNERFFGKNREKNEGFFEENCQETSKIFENREENSIIRENREETSKFGEIHEKLSFSFENSHKLNKKEVLTFIPEESSFSGDIPLLNKEESGLLMFQDRLNSFSAHSLKEKTLISFEKPLNSLINRIQSDPLMRQQSKFAKNSNLNKFLKNLRFSQKISLKSSDFHDKFHEKSHDNFHDISPKTSKKPLKNQLFAEKITIKGSYYGLIELTNKDFIFRTLDSERPDNGPTHIKGRIEPLPGDILYDFFPFGSKQVNFLHKPLKKQWNLKEILSVQGRSFNLRPCAFELFTQKSGYFFNVYSPKIAENLIKKLANLSKNPKNFFYNRKEAFKSSGILQKWINGDISNFEYLMQLNLFAGRTYNDIHQYPIFPWVLTDYKSHSLDLSSPLIYRDFSQPIGALDVNRLKILKENFRVLSRIPDGSIYTQPFLYGAHYSGLGPVLHYLVRIEPFTTQHTLLQSGCFDCPDRLFASIPQTWKSCERDYKELTPEFFYFPDFLINKSRFEFGSGQNGDIIDKVHLPKWANSAHEFVFRNWQALESEFSGKNLNKWIDLVFGYKQTGKNAVDSNNVFGFLTYEDNVNLLDIEDLKERKAVFEQIAEYGQTPHQLLITEHPEKENWRFDKGALLRKNIVISNESLQANYGDKNIVNSIDKNIGNSSEILQKFKGLCEIIAKNRECSVIKACFSNNYHDITVLFSNNLVVFLPVEDFGSERKKQVFSEKMRYFQITGKFSQNEASPSSQFFVIKRGKKACFFIAGLYDGSLKAFLNGKEAKRNGDFSHNKPISCVTCCEECEIVACGSKDCRISLWKFDKEMEIQLFCVIYGHNNEIITMKISEITDVLVSIDRDGVVLLHEIKKGSFIRRITVEMERNEIIKMIDIHDNGLILMGSSENRIFLYRFF